MSNRTIDVNEDAFVELKNISTQTAQTSDYIFNNIKINLQRGLTRLDKIDGFKTVKGVNVPIALVGGGPSLKETIKELKEFKGLIVACGSSHDYLVENEVIPDWCIACDPDAVVLKYILKPNKKTKFMLASGCDPVVFDSLKEYDIVLWHCHSDEIGEKIRELDPTYEAIGGGCTVGLRAISIAIMMGYSNIHMFGFDSCLSDNDDHHAYGFKTEEEGLGVIYNIKLGMNNEKYQKVYRCAGYQLAQLAHFKDFYKNYNQYFIPTFHGRGMLPDTMAHIRQEEIRLKYIPQTVTYASNSRNIT